MAFPQGQDCPSQPERLERGERWAEVSDALEKSSAFASATAGQGEEEPEAQTSRSFLGKSAVQKRGTARRYDASHWGGGVRALVGHL